MAGMWDSFREVFWSERFWLPKNYTWKNMLNTNPNMHKPQLTDLWLPGYISGALYIISKLFIICVGLLAGKFCITNPDTQESSQNSILEAVYCTTKAPSQTTIEAFAKVTKLKAQQIENWFRIKRRKDKALIIQEFSESSWRFIFYSVMFCFGLYTLWGKPWLWDTRMCWDGWPEHHMTSDLYWYYLVQFGYCILFTVQILTGPRINISGAIIVFQTAGLGFLFFSWIINLTRIGSLVLFVHSCAYPVLEAARMAMYVELENLCIVLLGFFVLVWFITRLVVFPYTVVRSTLFESIPAIGMCSVYFVSNLLLVLMQVLYIRWLWQVILMARVECQGQPKNEACGSGDNIYSETSDGMVRTREIDNSGVPGGIMVVACGTSRNVVNLGDN